MAAPFKLDDNLLQELGLGVLPVEEKNRMLQHIYETLEMRVGMRLAEQMSDQQLDEFESFIDRGDEPGALKWLEANFPNYKEVVAQELDKLKVEVKAVAPQIVAQSQAAAAQGGQPLPMAPVQPQQVPPQPYQPAPQPYQAPQPQYQQPIMQPAQAPMPQPQNPYQQPGQYQPQYAPAPLPPMPSTPSVPPMPPQPSQPQQYGAPQPMPQMPPSWQQPPQQ